MIRLLLAAVLLSWSARLCASRRPVASPSPQRHHRRRHHPHSRSQDQLNQISDSAVPSVNITRPSATVRTLRRWPATIDCRANESFVIIAAMNGIVSKVDCCVLIATQSLQKWFVFYACPDSLMLTRTRSKPHVRACVQKHDLPHSYLRIIHSTTINRGQKPTYRILRKTILRHINGTLKEAMAQSHSRAEPSFHAVGGMAAM